MEKIFISVAKGIDDSVPAGGQSHRDLLLQMSHETEQRPQLISTKTAKSLSGYLGFRHFYRHSYSFLIDWEELKKLVTPLVRIWADTKIEFETFIESLGGDAK